MATSTQTLVVGTRVQCALHYCGAGIVYAIHGEQSLDTVRTFMGGAGVSGGSARVDVVFANGHQAHQVPEAIVRGIQWRISDEVASAEMIAAALAHAACVQAQKRAVEDAAKAAYAAEVVRLQGAAEFAHLAQGDDRYSGTLAAANIRTELRRAFPGVKFSVRKSGHGTVNVRWTDGPTEAELKALREKKGSALGFVREIWDAIVEMPVELRKLGLVYLFQWYAMMCYWQYVTLSMAKSVWGTTDAHSEGFKEAVGWTGLINGWYNIVTFMIAFSLVAFARRRGAKFVHMTCLLLASAGLLIFPHLTNKYLLFIPIIGLGIAWASIMGVPYIMAVRMIPSTRYGVYMGIINMMIVIPMLIHSVTFGWVYTHVLGDNPNNAITFAALGLAAAAIAMLWIREPPIVRDVDDVMVMPGGGH